MNPTPVRVKLPWFAIDTLSSRRVPPGGFLPTIDSAARGLAGFIMNRKQWRLGEPPMKKKTISKRVRKDEIYSRFICELVNSV